MMEILYYISTFIFIDCATTHAMCNRSRTPPQQQLIVSQPPTPIVTQKEYKTNTNNISSNYWHRDYNKRRELMEFENEKYNSDTDSVSTANNSIEDITLHATCDANIHTNTNDINENDEKLEQNVNKNKKLKKSNSASKLLDWILKRN